MSKLLGVVLLVCLAACGAEGASRADVIAKIKSDPASSGTPDAAVECIADWYMTSENAERREAFVKGETKGAEADDRILECLKQAT